MCHLLFNLIFSSTPYLSQSSVLLADAMRVSYDTQAPQLWQGIAEHLATSSPEVLVLIHPINMSSSHSQRALQVDITSTTCCVGFVPSHPVSLTSVRQESA